VWWDKVLQKLRQEALSIEQDPASENMYIYTHISGKTCIHMNIYIDIFIYGNRWEIKGIIE
jgi:hypothetical protein